MKLFKTAALSLIIAFSLSLPAKASLRPPVYSAWVEGFMDSVDTEAVLEFVKADRGLICKLKSMARLGCKCSVTYRIKEVSRQPEWTSLEAGQTILHEYPCDRKGSFKWVGSSLPWASLNGEDILMTIRSSYLKPDGRDSYILDNDSRAFAPVIPPQQK